MTTRRIAARQVRPIGFGCMSLNHAYGVPMEKADAQRLLLDALELGYDHFDTAWLYGFGVNEQWVGEAFRDRRDRIFLASKCGMGPVDGKRVIDGRPETLAKTLDEALVRLGTDFIDLYYLHRIDPNVPVEESVGALARMVEAGKIGAIGLSENSAATLRRAHAVHAIAAVQNEYSPWSRNVEIGVLDACAELGTTLVAFSPLARGFLADALHAPQELPQGDIRKGMPRFQEPLFSQNLDRLAQFRTIAAEAGCSPAQLSLAWVLVRGEHVVAIPGTTRIDHATENFAAEEVKLAPEIVARVDALFGPDAAGPRYPAGTQAEIDTEEFA